MIGSPEGFSDLCCSAELSILLDCRYSELREALRNHPERLPRPLWINGRAYWPFQQIMAFTGAGYPLHFDADPKDFVPSAIAAFDGGRPEESELKQQVLV